MAGKAFQHPAARSRRTEKLRKEILTKHKVNVELHRRSSTTKSMAALAKAAGNVDILVNAGDIPAGTVEAPTTNWRRGFDLSRPWLRQFDS
jgi:NADP-dependent 3-hydroxy acid dehydrogenase YdfG